MLGPPVRSVNRPGPERCLAPGVCASLSISFERSAHRIPPRRSLPGITNLSPGILRAAPCRSWNLDAIFGV
jgi:hypothetical protein